MIITLCGSLKYEDEFKKWNERLTFAGHMVFTVTSYPSDHEGNKNWYTPEQKQKLDLAHKRKITASDGILVLDIDGYIGESTDSEIAHAKYHKKIVKYISYNHFGDERACPYSGCCDPYLQHPPCALCYE